MTLENKLLVGSILPLFFYAAWFIAAYKFVNIRDWPKYYKTILFFNLASAIYSLIFLHTYPLWQYKNIFLGHTFLDLLNFIIGFPCATIIFLHYYPKKVYKQIIYILMFMLIYTSVEFIFYRLNSIVYYNGWSIGWSAIHNLYQFPLLMLHQRNPIWAWLISFVALAIIMYVFNYPIGSAL